MGTKKTITLYANGEDRAIRAGEFLLLPDNPSIPVIVMQPAKGFNQKSWIQNVIDGVPTYQQISVKDNTVSLIEGTDFNIELKVIDPSNVNDVNSLSNLSFLWRKDGSPIYDLNKSNNGTGTNIFRADSNTSKANLSGRYLCEVSNLFGKVDSQELILNVINPLKHPKLYKNLINNGDGDGGTNGWLADADIRTSVFGNSLDNFNFGSFRFSGFSVFEYVKGNPNSETYADPKQFRFSIGPHTSLFFDLIWKSYIENGSVNLDSWRNFVATNRLPQIVANEDYPDRSEIAGFFPGVAWMDAYNKNGKGIGLLDEIKNYRPTYFTRSKLKFEKDGGKPSILMSQNIDVSEASELIDGRVYGVKYVNSQFFAYVGAGITGYKIKVSTTSGEKTFNYYIGDSEDVNNRAIGQTSQLSFDQTGTIYHNSDGPLWNPSNRIKLTAFSDIEIIPLVDDTTTIRLEYLGEVGNILKTETINGPDETDVWAIKEKVYFPASLYSIFEFIDPNNTNHNIKVFGQTYTTTDALKPFFESAGLGGSLKRGLFDPGATTEQKEAVKDKNIKFILDNIKFVSGDEPSGGVYPGKLWYMVDKDNKSNKAINDHGAAAMFGVGKNIIVPYKTRTIRVTVAFTHKSEVVKDNNPNIKRWTSPEIYSDDYGQSTGESVRPYEYGNPRCGITKMKLLLMPNNPQISEEYVSYDMPPASSTVVGLQKNRYSDPNAFNSVDIPTFTYNLTLPQALPNPPIDSNPFAIANNSNQVDTFNNNAFYDIFNASAGLDQSNPMGLPDEIVEQEDSDLSQGDYDNITGNEF